MKDRLQRAFLTGVGEAALQDTFKFVTECDHPLNRAVVSRYQPTAENIHQVPVCGDWAVSFVKRIHSLTGRTNDAKKHDYSGIIQNQYIGHAVASFQDEWLICGTWQQFRAEERFVFPPPVLPRVLVKKIGDDVSNLLQSAEIKRSLWLLWDIKTYQS